MNGKYLMIEGQDATGKDTQAKMLKKYLEETGKKVVLYSESGTGSEDEFVKEIAKLTFQSKQKIDHETRVMLYLINRYHQWRKLAEPMLMKGGVVIVTRNWFSTLIYEGMAGEVSLELIEKLHKLIMPERYFTPDREVILTLTDSEREKRLGTQKRKGEVWKEQSNEVQRKINEGYLEVAKKFKVPTVDAMGTKEEVFEKLKKQFGI